MGLYMPIRSFSLGGSMESSVNHANDGIRISDLIGPLNTTEQKRSPDRVYVRGDMSLASLPKVSVVGTREPSLKGIANAQSIVKMLVNEGVVIVSGLARGIDTVAHRTAIENGGRTIAVLGTPLDSFYPSENRSLQEEIGRDHLLVSQFAEGTKTLRSNFPAAKLRVFFVADHSTS